MKAILNHLFFCYLLVTTFPSFSQSGSNCSNNAIINPSLSQGQAASSGDQNIADAVGFSPIWSTGSLADFYVSNYAPSNYPPPSPATGNYVSCWIANYGAGGVLYREGFQIELSNTILKGSGSYELSFEMACLQGWGTSEVAVYGVTNSLGSAAPHSPTGAYSPSNLNLFGSSRTFPLGKVRVSAVSCTANKTRKSFTFNSNDINFPSQGITHIFITHSDNSTINGAHYMAFDNFCLPTPPTPCPSISNESLTCTGLDLNADGYLDYEYTFSVTPNEGSTSMSLTCGSLNTTTLHFSGGTGTGTYTLTFYPNDNTCSFSAHHYLSNNSPSQCIGYQSDPNITPCSGGWWYSHLAIHPNPAHTQLQLSWREQAMPNQVSVKIFNSNGICVQSIQQINSFDGHLIINIENLPKGMYYLQMQGEEYYPESMKFIKQ